MEHPVNDATPPELGVIDVPLVHDNVAPVPGCEAMESDAWSLTVPPVKSFSVTVVLKLTAFATEVGGCAVKLDWVTELYDDTAPKFMVTAIDPAVVAADPVVKPPPVVGESEEPPPPPPALSPPLPPALLSAPPPPPAKPAPPPPPPVLLLPAEPAPPAPPADDEPLAPELLPAQVPPAPTVLPDAP
jgi:hypothetical protein